MAALAALDEGSASMKRARFSEEQVIYAIGQAGSPVLYLQTVFTFSVRAMKP